MSFKVSFDSGTGNDYLAEDNMTDDSDAPFILEFDTREKRESFLIGVDMTRAVMDGWINAWVETKCIDD